MAKEFTVTFFYKEAAYSADVIMQSSDEEITLTIDVPHPSLHNILPGGKVKAVYYTETGMLKDPGKFIGYTDIIQSILKAVIAHEEKESPISLWS